MEESQGMTAGVMRCFAWTQIALFRLFWQCSSVLQPSVCLFRSSYCISSILKPALCTLTWPAEVKVSPRRKGGWIDPVWSRCSAISENVIWSAGRGNVRSFSSCLPDPLKYCVCLCMWSICLCASVYQGRSARQISSILSCSLAPFLSQRHT